MGKQKQQQKNAQTAIIILTVISYLFLLATPFLLLWRLPQYSEKSFCNPVIEQVSIKNIYSWKGRGLYLETKDGREFLLGGRHYQVKKNTGYDFFELEPTISGKSAELEYLDASLFILKLRVGDTEYDLTEVTKKSCTQQRLGLYMLSVLALAMALGCTYCCYQEFFRPTKKKRKMKK